MLLLYIVHIFQFILFYIKFLKFDKIYFRIYAINEHKSTIIILNVTNNILIIIFIIIYNKLKQNIL